MSKQIILKKWTINFLLLVLVYGILKGAIVLGLITRYHQGIIVFIMINIVLAASLNLVTGFLGQLTLGHAGFMAVGAYASAITSMKIRVLLPDMPDFMLLIISLIAAAIVASFVGVLIGIPALRLRGDYLAIITLGFGEVIRVVINNMRGLTGGAQGLTGIPKIVKFDSIFLVTVVVVLILFRLKYSRQGRAIMSIREDEIAAEAVGIKTTYFKVLGFAIAAGLAGVGGGLYANYLAFLDPNTFNFMRSVEILVIVVLGGMGSLTGTVISAIVLTILPEALRSFAEYRLLLYSFLLVVMMILKPEGIFGKREFSFQALKNKLTSNNKKESKIS